MINKHDECDVYSCWYKQYMNTAPMALRCSCPYQREDNCDLAIVLRYVNGNVILTSTIYKMEVI